VVFLPTPQSGTSNKLCNSSSQNLITEEAKMYSSILLRNNEGCSGVHGYEQFVGKVKTYPIIFRHVSSNYACFGIAQMANRRNNLVVILALY
jgi:hypothetical protein